VPRATCSSLVTRQLVHHTARGLSEAVGTQCAYNGAHNCESEQTPQHWSSLVPHTAPSHEPYLVMSWTLTFPSMTTAAVVDVGVPAIFAFDIPNCPRFGSDRLRVEGWWWAICSRLSQQLRKGFKPPPWVDGQEPPKSPLSSEQFDCGGGLEGAPGAGRGAAFSAAKAAEHTEPRNNASTTKGMRRARIAAPPILGRSNRIIAHVVVEFHKPLDASALRLARSAIWTVTMSLGAREERAA